MQPNNINVLIVDDSIFMRAMLKSAFADEPGIDIVGSAQNGNEGLAKIKELRPDVVTLDIEMPGLSGLEVLERVMKDSPLPIVMVSTKTQKGARATFDALELGAVDYVAKPLGEKSATLGSFRKNVIRAVRTAAQSNRKRLRPQQQNTQPRIAPESDLPLDAIVAIGISAGGPATLHKMMPAFPGSYPPIVITQHMPADFTHPFAERLNAAANLNIVEATHGMKIRPGMALIAPGSHHLRVVRKVTGLVAQLDAGPKVSGFRPSVDVLFESVATAAGALAVGVVMTGMGNDGSVGVGILKKHGGFTISQDKATSIVYGMPKAAADTGHIDHVAPLEEIPTAITDALSQIKVSQPSHA